MSAKLHPALYRAALGLSAIVLASCASVQPVTLGTAAAALQADGTPALSITGTGQWFQFGQAPAPGLPWPAFAVSRYSADIDYAAQAARVQLTRRQLIEPGRARPAPVDQSVDQYVAGAYAWNRATQAGGSGNAQPQPAAVEERAAEIWSTPQGFVRAAQANQAQLQGSSGGKTEVTFTVAGKQRYRGWINAQGQVERVQTWIDTPVLGDTLVETRFEGYKDFGGIPFPARIVRSQGGHPVLTIDVAEVKRGSAAALTAPQNVVDAKPAAVTVTATNVAPGVIYLTGGTHHSVAIEQRDHLVLVEAPQNEARSLAVLAKLKELLPAKPVKLLVNTHAHFDHSGGLRTYVAQGATIVTAEANKAFYEQAWAAPRTLNPDALAKAPQPARFQTFKGKTVINDGTRAIEIHEITGSGHNDAFALVYLPAEKLLVQADAFNPTAANAPAPTAPNPFTVNLYENLQRLKLDVTQIAALHGPGLVKISDLRTAVGITTTAQR